MCTLLHLLMIIAMWLAIDNRRAQSTTIKSRAQTIIYYASCRTLPKPYTNGALPRHELLEIHRSKISLHRAKAGYSYPTIRLPHSFSKLAGLPTRIYQTVHDGTLAFLVVLSPNEKTSKTPKASVFTRRRSGVRIAPGPSVFGFFCVIVKASAFV